MTKLISLLLNIKPVSYTHLDVYKRQILYFAGSIYTVFVCEKPIWPGLDFGKINFNWMDFLPNTDSLRTENQAKELYMWTFNLNPKNSQLLMRRINGTCACVLCDRLRCYQDPV